MSFFHFLCFLTPQCFSTYFKSLAPPVSTQCFRISHEKLRTSSSTEENYRVLVRLQTFVRCALLPHSTITTGKDPLHYNDYLTRNIFMPLVNGEVDHPLLPVFKQNFVRLSKLVLFGGPDDGVIDPWQSALFSFWETGGAHNLLPMEKQHLYLHDTFGLQTLHKQGKIVQYIVPGIKHLSWKANQTNLVERILPHLN